MFVDESERMKEMSGSSGFAVGEASDNLYMQSLVMEGNAQHNITTLYQGSYQYSSITFSNFNDLIRKIRRRISKYEGRKMKRLGMRLCSDL